MILAQTAGMTISNGGGASILGEILLRKSPFHQTFEVVLHVSKGAWAPTYYTQALGVPLSKIGVYLTWPMMVGFFGANPGQTLTWLAGRICSR
eukprot:SAG31_NODE_3265_length_4480_cov_19.931066_4_plen_93_part_00